jgi:cysteine desulfurase
VRKLAVDSDGRIDLDDVTAALATPTGLVSVMLANNETGVIQDVAAVAEKARAARAWMHTDAVQALGKIAVDFEALNVHAMTLSAHKIYGPKGVGALVLDKRIELKPLISGGGHEQGLRSGTENVAGIVGFGAACELAMRRMGELTPTSASNEVRSTASLRSSLSSETRRRCWTARLMLRPSSWLSTGLVKKSWAPARIAARAVSMFA